MENNSLGPELFLSIGPAPFDNWANNVLGVLGVAGVVEDVPITEENVARANRIKLSRRPIPRTRKYEKDDMKKFKELKFKCSGCGECCRHISDILPEFDTTGDGICCHLTEDGKCDIYETRPLVCNVDGLYDSCMKRYMTRKSWHSLNYLGCKNLTTQNED